MPFPLSPEAFPRRKKPLNQGVISAIRKTWGEESCLILMNISADVQTVELSRYSDWALAAALSADGEDISLDNGILTLPAFGTAILIP